MTTPVFSQEEKIAIVLMHLPPTEIAEVLGELTPDETQHFSALYANLPELSPQVREGIFLEMLDA